MQAKKMIMLCVFMMHTIASYQIDHDRTPSVTDPTTGIVSLLVDGLYWRAYEDGLDYAIKNNNGAVFINTAGQIERAQFDWHGGFRVGATHYHKERDMGITAYWTGFNTSGNNSAAGTFPVVLFPVWSNPGSLGTYAEQACASVDLHLNMADVHVHSWFSPTCHLDLMPLMGIAYVRSNQSFAINTSGNPFVVTAQDAIRMCNNFHGVGPKVGMYTHWLLGCNIGFFSQCDAALLYGKFNVRQHETITFSNNSTVTTPLDITCNRSLLCRPRLNIVVGLAWQQAVCDDAYSIAIKVGWEQLYFFGQNQLMRFSDDVQVGANTTVNGDLALQGLTVRIGFGFN